MLHQDICTLYDSIAVYADYGGIVFAEEEGRNIAKALGEKNKVSLSPQLSLGPQDIFSIRYTNTLQAAILMNHGLLTVGSTVDEASFLFGLLDRSCAIQLQIEAACVGSPALKKHIISDEEAAYNFKMASEKNALYAEMQPDLEFELESVGLEAVQRGWEGVRIDHGEV